jgi:thiamine-phosphate pyrophosphorylase
MTRIPAGVYAIVDARPEHGLAHVESMTRALLSGGARVLQLRAKSHRGRALLALAHRVRVLTEESGATFIVDDRPDVAVLCGADGVHLGQNDLDAVSVRRWFPVRKIIGVSCHDLAQAERVASSHAADYIGFGPVYPTRSKEAPDPVVGVDALARVCAWAGALPLDVVAIGGITVDRLPEIRSAGARGAALISALLGASDIRAATERALEQWAAV